MALIADFHIPWHPTKTGKDFVEEIVFIGFHWDLRRRRVSLPLEKRLKFLRRVQDFIAHKTVTLLQVQEIHGSLFHVTFVYRDGSSRLPVISRFIAVFKSEHAVLHIPCPIKDVLIWWEQRLSDPLVFCRLEPLPPLKDLHIYVDASTSWGIGIVIGRQWYAFRLTDTWKMPGRSIGWLETMALEILTYFLAQFGFRN